MSKPDIILAIEPLVDIFETIKIAYYIGGSIASSAHGIARATMDVDIVADIKIHHVEPLVKSLESQYYISSEAIKDAIQRLSSFNLIHLETIIKIDIFISKGTQFNKQTFIRKQCDILDESISRKFYLPSPEDIVLIKLDWYKKGGEISDQQWKDILGVLKVQSNRLDLDYLHHWACELDVMLLLDKALENAGIKNHTRKNGLNEASHF